MLRCLRNIARTRSRSDSGTADKSTASNGDAGPSLTSSSGSVPTENTDPSYGVANPRTVPFLKTRAAVPLLHNRTAKGSSGRTAWSPFARSTL